MPKAMLTYRCPRCGGDNVGYDANSTWCDQTQSWVLGSTFDDGWCNDCGEIRLDEQKLSRAEAQQLRTLRARQPVNQLLAAAREAEQALAVAVERLEINNCQGEENAAIRQLRRRRAVLRKAITGVRTSAAGAL